MYATKSSLSGILPCISETFEHVVVVDLIGLTEAQCSKFNFKRSLVMRKGNVMRDNNIFVEKISGGFLINTVNKKICQNRWRITRLIRECFRMKVGETTDVSENELAFWVTTAQFLLNWLTTRPFLVKLTKCSFA